MNRTKRSLALVPTLLAALFAVACSTVPQGSDAPRSAGETIDDGVITARVKTALIEDDRTKARQIDVDTYEGNVQLNGFVDTAAARTAAVQVARNVKGVRSVKNNLQIRAADRTVGQTFDDATITARVKTALIGDPRTKAFRINVTTNDGIVQLGGSAPSREGKAAAEELARSVPGVKDVSNDLRIEP